MNNIEKVHIKGVGEIMANGSLSEAAIERLKRFYEHTLLKHKGEMRWAIDVPIVWTEHTKEHLEKISKVLFGAPLDGVIDLLNAYNDDLFEIANHPDGTKTYITGYIEEMSEKEMLEDWEKRFCEEDTF